jgi:hypothetical protein
MKNNFCGKCGTTNNGQMSFCLQCGQNLEVETVNQANDRLGQNQQSAQPPPFSPAQPPNYAVQNVFSPPANELPPTSPGFQPFPQNFNSPNNFAPPNNNGFQPPAFQQMPFQPAAAAPPKSIGTKIWGILGSLLVGLFFLIKGGSILLRAGRIGGSIGLIIALVLIIGIIAIIGIVSLVKRNRR